jgi:SAM-dependent methyltransferase
MGKYSFSIVTELPHTKVTPEQLSRAYLRYKFAQSFCKGKDVLELASGGGQGLGLLAKVARNVIGSDIDEKNLEYMRSSYLSWPNVTVACIDAQDIKLANASVDVVILFEAIYYLTDSNAFLSECKRVLKRPGKLIICSANKEWRDFNPSVFSVHYFSAKELAELLISNGFAAQMFYSDQVSYDGYAAKILSIIKRIAVRLHCIPRSMRFKKYLKRIVMGPLIPMPAVLDDSLDANIHPNVLNLDCYDPDYKIMFAIGELT